jgi:hypothetical protein
MRVDQIVAAAASHFIARLLRLAVAAVALLIFAVVAVYHFTIAGMIALDGQVGALDTRLIVGGVYAALALVALAFLLARGRRNGKSALAPALGSSREVQLIMIVEAVMLGYSLARKRERAS